MSLNRFPNKGMASINCYALNDTPRKVNGDAILSGNRRSKQYANEDTIPPLNNLSK